MRLRPVRHDELNATALLWLPFLPSIARRTKESIQNLAGQIMRREVWITLIWDETIDKPVALIGVRFHMRDRDMIAEWLWMTGHHYKDWMHLLPEFEELLRKAGAVECRPLCRPGWAKILKAAGYRLTHVQMEKTLG
jgi:hypothetical protein